MTTCAPISDSNSDYMFSHNLLDYDFEFNYHNMVEQRTLRELAAPDVNYNALCLEYHEVAAPFELNMVKYTCC